MARPKNVYLEYVETKNKEAFYKDAAGHSTRQPSYRGRPKKRILCTICTPFRAKPEASV